MKRTIHAVLLTGASLLAASTASAQAASAGQVVTPDQPSTIQQPNTEDRSPAARSTADNLTQGTAASPTQDTAPGSATDAGTDPAATATTSDVVVTGSRVITNGNNSPTPVSVIPTEQFLKLAPTTVTDAVNLLPALQGSQGTTSRPGGGQRNGAGSYFNLRNMGNLRTLVLYDGQRLVPTINQNEADVDAQIIPQLLIKRVDVVTGGVSAVYGSDAISGVINFITDRDFNGIKVQGQNGITTYGDSFTWDAGIAAGTRIGERLHIEGSYQHHDDAGIVSRNATGRSFFDRQTGAGGNGTTVPYFNFDNQLQSNFTYGGLIVNNAANGALRDLMFTPSGTLTPFVHGLIPTATGLVQGTTLNASTGIPTNVESGGSGTFNQFASLKAGIKFDQGFGRVDYELTDSIHAYAQLGVSRIHSFNNFQSLNPSGIRVSYANPYLDNAFSAANLSAAGLTAAQITALNATRAAALTNPSATANTFTFSRFFRNEPRADQYTKSYIGYAGLEGSLGTFKWDVTFGKSESEIHTVNRGNVDNGRLFAALDTTRNAQGTIVCRASLTNTAYAGCQPLNLFGEGQASQAATDYIFRTTDIWNRTRQEELSGSISGAPFSTWAGPVNMAVSGEYRRLRWDVRSNATPNDFADCTGIALNCTQGRTFQWFFNTMSPLNTVAQRVGEVAYEADVPLVKDVPLIQSFDVTGAVRYTHYNTSGDAWTWKLGGDWHISDDLRLRATRSRDIRAPNLFELYSPIQRNPTITATDPRTNVQVQNITNVQTPNGDLTPEKADTFTAGAVFTPTFIPRFSVSVDYFKIKVDDAIFLLQGFSTPVLRQCLGTTVGTTPANAPSYCSSFVTLTNGVITQTLSTYLNIATFKTEGVDTEVNYRVPVFGHDLALRGLVSYQPKLTYNQGPAGVLEVAGVYTTGTNRVAASPKWKVTGIVSYDVTDDFSVTVLERWRSGLRANADRTLQFSQGRLPSLGYTTINLDWHVKTSRGDFNMFFNAANVFNKFPTVYYSGTQFGTTQGLPEGDDPTGRYLTVGVKLKL